MLLMSKSSVCQAKIVPIPPMYMYGVLMPESVSPRRPSLISELENRVKMIEIPGGWVIQVD